MEPRVVVSTKSAWLSKINWSQVIAIVAMVGTTFNLFELTPDEQIKILSGIVAVQGAVTFVLKTFFTSTITPSSVPPNAITE